MTSTGPEHPSQPHPAEPAPGAQPAPEWQQAAEVPGQPAQPQYAWAQPAVQLQTVETEPLEYHRLLRGVQGYTWWKPLLLLLLSGVYFGVLTVLITFIFIPIGMVFDPSYFTDVATGAAEIIDTQRPVSVALSMVSIIIMIPAVLLAMLSLGTRPVGRVWSVAARMRWGLLGKLFGAAVLAVIAMNLVGMGVEILLDPTIVSTPAAGETPEFNATAALWSLALIIVLVPFQATAEEVVFRGLFMQVLGAWLKNPWFAILIPTVGFALAHIYDFWGLAAVGLMGGVAAWLTWRTGGLEAAIAIHVVNNLIAFGLMTAGVGGSTAQTAESGGLGSLIGEIAGLGLFIWLTLRVVSRDRHGRTRIDLVQRAVPIAPMPAPQPGTPQGWTGGAA
ncbi:CPBP family intramembrane glutamic endopeptidase [Leucobacter chromiireducens]|uniref:CPBP family intramembrane glutamic endopeptidase n=1 Tax=Leucobacter chromiireducens TaxID=283877 RepID=UPI000F63A589|nr:CPBP family intramembrane glutamic endopeptidase [Leucobacter chromiireducens]